MKKNRLLLTLSKAAFDVMITGEKTTEYRKFSKWIKSRLLKKDGSIREYDYIKFVNGYGHDKPYFLAYYKGFEIEPKGWNHNIPYTNGLIVGKVSKGDFKIFLGNVFYKSNNL